MKKTMKSMLAFVVGALCLTGCEQDKMIEEISNTRLVTLTALQEGEDVTKAAIDGTTTTQINWSEGDKINYFGAGIIEYMTLKSGAGTASGTFQGTVTPGTQDYVLYPYQSSARCSEGVITAEVPMTQYAVQNSFDPAAALMVGEVQGSTVEFKNVMSFVKVTIPSNMSQCRQVSLKAKDAWTTVAGRVNITASTGEWSETSKKEGQAFVRLLPKSGTYLEAGASYYIAILPHTMDTGFELIFNDEYTSQIKVKQSRTEIVTFERSKTKKLGTITDFTYTVSAVTVTPGLMVADHNIGAASHTDNGDYFAWAALRPAYVIKPRTGLINNFYKSGGFTAANAPYYDGGYYKYDSRNTLESQDDIVAMLWGGHWRMPTNAEITNLINLPSRWINVENEGLQIGSSPNRVFLPAAGYCYNANNVSLQGSEGRYWSSTLERASTANNFFLDSSGCGTNYQNRNYGYSVRAVFSY